MIRSMAVGFLCLSLLALVGCGGSDSTVPFLISPSSTVNTSNLIVTGIINNQVLADNSITLNVKNGVSATYSQVRYELDPPATFPTGAAKTTPPDSAITLSNLASGNHKLYIQGVYSDGTSDQPLLYTFTVSRNTSIAVGKFRGDYVYYTNDASRSSMTLKVVDSCDLTRSNDIIAGTMTLSDGSKMKVSDRVGSSIANNANGPTIVNLIMDPVTAGADSFSGVGTASEYQILFADAATYFNNNPTVLIRGDIRLYRDMNYLLRASANLTPSNQPNSSPVTAYITLFSLDNRKYEGHVRLVSQSSNKILTYKIAGSTATGLSVDKDGMNFTLSYAGPTGVPFSPESNDFGATHPLGSGSVVVGDGTNGKLVVKQLRLTIDGLANYYSTGSITTITPLAKL